MKKREITDQMRARIENRGQTSLPPVPTTILTARAVAASTMEIAKTGSYELAGKRIEIAAAVQECLEKTRVVLDAAPLVKLARATPIKHQTRIEVTAEKTADCVRRLLNEGSKRVALLNFANGTHVGGGFMTGARAQEEDLCRCSALFDCLTSKKAEKFYTENEAAGTALVSDAMIVSPAVPFFRAENWELLEQPFQATVITAAAPDQFWLAARVEDGLEKPVEEETLEQVFADRARAIIAAAYDDGAYALVLGAWGCGAFGNDPEMVAAGFQEAIADLGACLPRISFAVWSAHEPSINRFVFENRLLGERGGYDAGELE